MLGLFLEEKWYNLKFLKLSLLECNPARPFPIIFIFVTVIFREKHGLVRNDFLDCMMELREASKDEAQGDVQSEENSNTDATYSKLQFRVTIQGEGTLGNILFGLSCVAHNCPKFGREILESITDNSFGSKQKYFLHMKRLKEPVNSDHTSSVIVYISMSNREK